MRRYMWPNSCLPSATGLIIAAQGGSQGRFTLDGVENHAPRMYPAQRFIWVCLHDTIVLADYPRTLREWGRRLDANLKQDLIIKDYPALKDRTHFEAFKRKWQYLFAYAGAGFAKGYITCHMISFVRPVSMQ